MSNPIAYSEVQKPRDLGSDLLAWAPAIANGSAMVALTGVIGNVDDPDRALSALMIPMLSFGLGLVLALISAAAASRQISLEKERASYHLVYEAATRREQEAAVEATTRLPDLEALRIVNPEQAESQFRSIYRLLLERHAALHEWADQTRSSSLASLALITPKVRFWGKVSSLFAVLSILFAGAAFLIALLGPAFGARLQDADPQQVTRQATLNPHTSSAPRLTPPVGSPPSRTGASASCRPSTSPAASSCGGVPP